MNKPLKIYLSNLTYDTISIATDAFPLNIGYLASYSKKKFGDDTDFTLFKYIDELDKSIRDSPPDILGMSNYIWNYNIGLEFFRIMKEISPNTLLVWGGPNFPLDFPSQKKFMENHPEFDIYVPIRGEIGFVNIIERMLEIKGDFDKEAFLSKSIPDCILRNSDGKIQYAFDNNQIKKLDEIPSPYTTGFMDKFFDGKLNPIIQTSRGCPFKCTFCVDGNDLVNQVNQFSQEYIKDELMYIANHIPKTVHTLHVADLNFGMLPGDLDTCKIIKEIKDVYGYPRHIISSTGKNRKEQIIDAIKLLDGAANLTMSVQSMDQTVLKNIKRDNIKLDHMMALKPAIKETGLISKAEVILSLPGETYQSTLETLRKLVRSEMDDITIHTCILLHGSEMNTPEERKKWKFKSKFRIVPRDFGILSNGKKVCEYEEVVVATDTLTFEEYVDLRLLALVLWINTKGIIFDPILKFLREQNIDVFELHYLMVNNRNKTSDLISKLFKKFNETTKNELFDSPEDIFEFIQNNSNYQKLLNEEIGINAVQSYHGYVLDILMPEWSSYVLETAQYLLKNKTKMEKEIFEQFNDISKFILGSSFNPLGQDRMSNNPEYSFQYDINRWQNDNTNKKLDEFKFRYEERIMFKFTEQQFKIVQDTLDRYPANMSGRGLALKSISMKDLWRKPVFIKPLKLDRIEELSSSETFDKDAKRRQQNYYKENLEYYKTDG